MSMDVFRTVCAAVVALCVAGLLPPCLAQEAGQCYSSSDIAGSVLGTFFSTLAAIAIAFIVYWFFCRKRRAKARLSQSFDGDVEAYARVNPAFQDDEPEKLVLETAENGKPLSEVSRLQFFPETKVPSSNANKGKKAKATKTNPFSVFSHKGTQPTRAQDDSCLHQEPERLEVSLRGCDFTGLGFNIYGNIRNGIYVRDVLHRGPASESGKIKADDRITSVTVSFDKITIEDALTILSYASPYDVTLELQKTSEQPGFVPGHQKKGSTASSTSGSLNAAASDRLAHPMYRSQSSDDVSQFGRDATGKKSSLSVGVPAKLKKDTIVKPSHSLRKETISEGEKTANLNEGIEAKLPRIGPEKSVVVTSPDGGHAEVKVMVHKEEKQITVDMPDGAAEKTKSSSLGSLKRLGNQIGGFMKEIVSSSSSSSSSDGPTHSKKEEEIKRGKEAPERASTNPFEVHVNVVDGKNAAKQVDTLHPGIAANVPAVSLKMNADSSSVDARGPQSQSGNSIPLPVSKMSLQLLEPEPSPPKASSTDKGLMMDVEEHLAKVGVSLSPGPPDSNKDQPEVMDVTLALPQMTTEAGIKESVISEKMKLPSKDVKKNPFDVAVGQIKTGIDDLHSTVNNINVDLNMQTNSAQMGTPENQSTIATTVVADEPAPNLDVSIPQGKSASAAPIQLPVVGDLPSQLEQFNKEVSGLMSNVRQVSNINTCISAVELDDILVEVNSQSNSVKASANGAVNEGVEKAKEIEKSVENETKGLIHNVQMNIVQTGSAGVAELQAVASQLEAKVAQIQNAASDLVNPEDSLKAKVALPQLKSTEDNLEAKVVLPQLVDPEDNLEAQVTLPLTNVSSVSVKAVAGEHVGKKKPFNPNRNGIASFDGVVVALPSMADAPVPEMGSEVTVTSSSLSSNPNSMSDILAEAKSSAEQIILATMTDLQNSSEVTPKKVEIRTNISKGAAPLPLLEIKAPLPVQFDGHVDARPVLVDAADSGRERGSSGKDKAPSPPSLSPSVLDATLDENINYFESKMQTVLQKGSPKTKPKRTSTPGKRKAPPPPATSNGTNTPEAELVNSGNPFVVGLNSSINDIDVDAKTETMTVVFLKPNNVTTVQVNAADSAASTDNLDPQLDTNHSPPMDESKSKKGNGKIDVNCGFGFRKTNFFEGLDKAGNDDLPKKNDGDRFHSIPRTGLSVQSKSNTITDEKSSYRRSSSLGDLTKINETNSKPLPLERAVSMDLNNAEDAVGQLGELSSHEENERLETHNSSDETLLSNIDIDDKMEHHSWSAIDSAITSDTMLIQGEMQKNTPGVTQQDLEQWIDEKQANKQSHKKFNIIQGLFKKEKGTKRKKKEATNGSGKSKIPVPVSSMSSPNCKDKADFSESLMVESGSQMEVQETSVDLDNDKDVMFEVSLSEKDMSLSSSSLSGDSLEEDKDLPAQATKRRIVAVEGEEADDEHEKAVWKRENISITFPVIPPIIREKREMRLPESEKDGIESIAVDVLSDGVPAKQARLTGDVRSLSPTKFPRIWPVEETKASKENGEREETNGNGSSSNPFQYTVNYESHHNNNSDESSNSESVTVTTMHITKTNLNSDLYTAYPVTSQGTVSKVIIATPQLNLAVEPPAHAAGPESPPPTLQPLE